jgi:hypothetical protein
MVRVNATSCSVAPLPAWRPGALPRAKPSLRRDGRVSCRETPEPQAAGRP